MKEFFWSGVFLALPGHFSGTLVVVIVVPKRTYISSKTLSAQKKNRAKMAF
jgi:hypothetical protein